MVDKGMFVLLGKDVLIELLRWVNMLGVNYNRVKRVERVRVNIHLSLGNSISLPIFPTTQNKSSSSTMSVNPNFVPVVSVERG